MWNRGKLSARVPLATIVPVVLIVILCGIFGSLWWEARATSAQTLPEGLYQCAAEYPNNDTGLESCTAALVDSQLKTHTTAQLLQEAATSSIPAPFGGCHTVAHVIGEETYKKYQNVEETLAECTDACNDGCLHGAVGEAIAEQVGANDPGVEIAHMTLQQIESIAPKYCSNPNLCHGVGHVLEYGLENLKQAANACKDISTGVSLEYCVSGVYMQGVGGVENTLTLGTSTQPLANIPSDDYAYPCDQASPENQHACFWYLPEYQQILFQADGIQDIAARLAKAESVCESFTDPTRSYCFEGMGRFIDNYTPTYEVPANVCENLPTQDDEESCILGRVDLLRGFDHYADALNLCLQFGSASLQNLCFNENFEYDYYASATTTAQSACENSSSNGICESQFNAFEKARASLPDYIFGLFGKLN